MARTRFLVKITLCTNQLDMIGLFVKVSQIFCGCLGYFENRTFHFKTSVATFWVTIKKFGLLFVVSIGKVGLLLGNFWKSWATFNSNICLYW